MTYSLCLNHSKVGFVNIPEEGCVDTNKALDKDLLNVLSNGTTIVLDIAGVACSCLTSGCNDPRGTYVTQIRTSTICQAIFKHTTTLFSLSDHYILSREWEVIVDLVQTNYHG